MWSRYDVVAEHAPFRANCDVTRGKVKAHRSKERVSIATSVYDIPIAQRRNEGLLKDEDFCVLEAEEAIQDD